MSSQKVTIKEMQAFCRHLAREYGLSYPPAKFSLVENRIEPLFEAFSCKTLSDLMVRSKNDLEIRRELLNHLTTNESWFFRHPSHFRILSETIIPQLVKKKKESGERKISIWSAGCSIGAELYSILITIIKTIPDSDNFRIELTGSDLSADAVAKAKNGLYSPQELRLVDYETLNHFFSDEGEGYHRILPKYSQHTKFETLNLLDNWPARSFDIIFCRNTMIYFTPEIKKKITERFYRALNIDGYYFTSANETIHWQEDESSAFKSLFLEDDIVYQKVRHRQRQAIFKFETPSDLLRAVNILNESGMEYKLEKIPITHSLAPSRAIYLDYDNSDKAEELFQLSSLKNIRYKKLVK